MPNNEKIARIKAIEILDSRGVPTLEVSVKLTSGAIGTFSVPSGASCGRHEALELRDKDSRYMGKGVLKAVNNVNTEISDLLIGSDPFDQISIDSAMKTLDGTYNKSRLGGNAILAVSAAVTKAAADSLNIPLYKYINILKGDSDKFIIPIPLINVLNGGKHATLSTDIQEIMIIPVNATNFKEAIRIGAEIFHTLGDILKEKGYATTVGDEGGYAPSFKNGVYGALDMLMFAIEKAGYRAYDDVVLALDVAASELYHNGNYNIDKKEMDADGMIEFYSHLINKYPIKSIEDGLDEDDVTGWSKLNKALGNKMQLVGDDLFTTDISRLNAITKMNTANAAIIKPNQVGTVTETLQFIKQLENIGYGRIVSHRSGDTEDSFIADLAVGTASGQIKTGSLSRSERMAKYNRLIKIEDESEDKMVYNSNLKY